MADCGQKFDRTGEGTSEIFRAALDIAGSKAAEQANDTCKSIWDCKKVADYGVKSVSVKETSGAWTVTYTGTFSCEKTQADVDAAQQAAPMCDKLFNVTAIGPTDAIAESRAGDLAKAICARLQDCNKIIRVSRNVTSEKGKSKFSGDYKCVKEDTDPKPGEEVIPPR